MILVSIYKDDTLTNRGQFSSQEEADAWIAFHQFENPVIEDITQKVAQEQINSEALQFLASTDYYIIREIDSGVPCPAEIKAQRQAARERIIK